MSLSTNKSIIQIGLHRAHLGLYNLRCKIFRCVTESPGSVGDLLGEPEVCDDGVALGVQEDVLGLEVPVGDVEAVKIGEGGDDLRRVELYRGWGQSVVHPHEGEQLAARLEREQEVEIVRVLPAVSQRYQERVVDFLNICFVIIDIVR